MLQIAERFLFAFGDAESPIEILQRTMGARGWSEKRVAIELDSHFLPAARFRAIEAALPGAARPEEFMPVRPLSNGHVELLAHDTTGRHLAVLLSGTQALAVGAHLSAYAAISLDRIGHKLDDGLPELGAAPPLIAGNDAEVRP